MRMGSRHSLLRFLPVRLNRDISMKMPSLRSPVLCLCMAFMSGCAGLRTHGPQASVASPGQRLLASGLFKQAAQQLQVEANDAKGEQRTILLADTAYAWHQAGDDAQSRIVLLTLPPKSLPLTQATRLQLISADLAISAFQPERALKNLGASPPAGLADETQIQWHRTRARALQAIHDPYRAAAELARADSLLTDQDQRINRQKIDQLLQEVSLDTLNEHATALADSDPLYPFIAEILLRHGRPLPHPLAHSEQMSQTAYARLPAEADGYHPPAKVAVLLPLTGKLAPAASPVRDGLLTAYYARGIHRPELLFYDTTGTTEGTHKAYARARAENVNFVIGPLSRNEVTELFSHETLTTPVLALNQAFNHIQPPHGSFEFSLAPEDEGISAADHLLAENLHSVFIIANTDETGQRAADAFARRWENAHGRVVSRLNVPNIPGDVTKQFLAAQDADALFLAIRASTARALVQQLKQTHLNGKPRIATSLLTAGTGRAETDRILEGIIFPIDTWDGQSVAGLASSAEVSDQLPSARGPGLRLFAFGFDAWNICAYLDTIADGKGQSIRGATGLLRMDAFGDVIRQPIWASFHDGERVLLPSP